MQYPDHVLELNSWHLFPPAVKYEIHGFYPPCIGVLFQIGLCRPLLPCVLPLMTHQWGRRIFQEG